MDPFISYIASFFAFWLGSVVASAVIAGYKKLSVIGFTFLAIFTGPLALLIVLLVSDGKARISKTTPSAKNLLSQLSSLKE
ncbi:MAG: hypothetical protein JW867_08845, partial [Candidatus Omnitrophica bacterium]|nr:hypothetical protein [Candidatus Omnitrophota bacterium]